MLTVKNLSYRIAGRPIFDEANATIMDGWKVGVVGPNGVGKSTLFKLIAGELQLDGGSITLSQKYRLGMVRQDLPSDDTPLIDVVLAADTERADLMARSETETDPYALAEIHTRLTTIEAYAAPARAATILAGLGFDDSQLQNPISDFSGGWRMRVALAAALFQQPEVLLLDEPTNHLDMEALMWLEGYLASYPHTLLVISHDRGLLNICADHILHVDNKQLTLYTGNYDTFERERAEKLSLQQKMHEKQQALRAHMQSFIDRFRAKASKARQAQSRMKALERMDIVEAVMADRARSFNFAQPEELAPPLLTINHADVGYAPNAPVLRNVNERIDMDDRIALLGANGNGKSTLIKLIAGKLAAQKGDVWRNGKLRIGYFAQHQAEELDVNSTPYAEMFALMKNQKEPAVRAYLGRYGFSRELADNRIGDLSGGEKARLLFAFLSYQAPHLMLLDEPTNHLDMDAREALVRALNEYNGAVVMVSHDPSMVERVADRLWLVENGKCVDFDGDLTDYRRHVLDARRRDKAPAKEKEKEEARKPSFREAKRLEQNKRRQYADLLKKISEGEKKMEKLNSRKADMEKQMADPALYEDSARLQDMQFEYGRLLKELSDVEEQWLANQDTYENAEVTS